MDEQQPTMAELWATSQEDRVSEEEYYERWAVVRSIVETVEKRTVSREEVATWRPRPDHVITLMELIAESWEVPEPDTGCTSSEEQPPHVDRTL